jgi:hypothetical protein
MSQNHFTISFPLKFLTDATAMADLLPPMMPEMFRAQEAIGTIHSSRFTVLDEKTLLFLGDLDGEFGESGRDSPARLQGLVSDYQPVGTQPAATRI